ncbi:MAG: hypothetical protein RBS53_11680 [Bacteroidales bacterium]|jgi:hypothetical protein|nr:hypothetical protein [Bacteroidales bacterium]
MKLYEKILIFFFILASLGLYQLRGLGIVVRLLDIFTVGFILIAYIVYAFWDPNKERLKAGFRWPIILLLVGVFISSVAAEVFHDQSLHLTFYQQRHMYAFLFYFLLIYMAPKPDWLIDVLFYFGVIGGLFFLAQYFLYPTLITDAKIFLGRGTIRMNLPGTYYMHIAFFLSVDRFFTTYEKKYGLGMVLLLLVAFLSAFRSTIASYALITTGFILLNTKVRNKVLLFGLYGLLVVAGGFAFSTILMEMKTSAERETSQGSSYIRVRAAGYFFSKNEEHKVTYIIGNGEPTERSPYGRKLAVLSFMSGFYLSDVGIIGFYFKYGLMAALVMLFVMFKIIFTRLNRKVFFIKLFFLFHLLLILIAKTSFEFLDSIIAVCMMLYLFDYYASSQESDPIVITPEKKIS